MNSSITMNKGRKIQNVLFLGILVLLPSLVMGECTCELEEGDNNKHEALKYKGAAIASILVACAIGVCIPMLGKIIPALQPDKDLFFVIKAFAAGVILATGFVHVLPDAFDHLTSPCLSENPWGNFPFTGFVAMLSAIGTLMVDAFATCYYCKSDDQLKKAQPLNGDDVHIHTHSTHGSPEAGAGAGPEDPVRHRVISQVLELGIVVHSVIIGISLGASESPKTIKPLFVALTFHQFFEGIGLGGCISQAKFKPIAVAVMALSFCLTTPVGIVIGIGITNVYKENSPTALIVEGILNAASAGILIYMALVDLLAADFMNAKMQNNRKLQLEANVSLLLGAALMSLLAKWA